MGSRRLPFLICIFFISLPPLLPCAARSDGMSVPPIFGVALDGYPITGERLEQIQEQMGLCPGVVLFFLQWPPLPNQGEGHFPKESLNAIWNTGAIPCLTWEPMYYRDGQERMVPYQAVLTGDYDPYIDEFASQAALWGKPFMIRFAHEMNIQRYHWGTTRQQYGPESTTIYRKMFRYVVKKFREAGAKNVRWVFCPNAESVPNTTYDPSASWNRIERYYPGDSYVDILGVDGYNWGNSRTKERDGWDSQWNDFTTIFAESFTRLKAIAPEKPLFIFETASVRQGGDRELWIKRAFEAIRDWHIDGLIWFQVHKVQDWRLTAEKDVADIDRIRIHTSFPQQWIKEVVP